MECEEGVNVRVGEDAGRLLSTLILTPDDVTRRRVAITRADSRTPAALKWMCGEGWKGKGQARGEKEVKMRSCSKSQWMRKVRT